MPFPEVKRVIYNKNPLDSVICQLRFPSILQIDSESPAKFQEVIRKTFPIFEEGLEIQQEIFSGQNPQAQNQIINPMSNVTTIKNYSFISKDGGWKINLTRSFISLSTAKYEQWEDFVEKFKLPIQALNDIYKPPFYTRLGLRYIDVFRRSVLYLGEVAWKELIQSCFIGVLATDISSYIDDYSSTFEINLDHANGQARIISGLITDIQSKEKCFLLDGDFYSINKVEIEERDEMLNFLHSRSTRLLRYAIKEKLHLAMEPTEL